MEGKMARPPQNTGSFRFAGPLSVDNGKAEVGAIQNNAGKAVDGLPTRMANLRAFPARGVREKRAQVSPFGTPFHG